jgi:hypothetical protein
MRRALLLVVALTGCAGCDTGPYLTVSRARSICQRMQTVELIRRGDAAFDSCLDLLNDEITIRD